MNVLTLAVLLLSGAAPAAAVMPGLTGIGVAAAVLGKVEAVAPGAPAGRILGSGKPVYLNDHVTTGPGGHLQLLLRDQTTFTLGPNSDMVLDTFVYDPATNAGKVSASITKGVFRFVTGKIARRKPDDMKVSLPLGTIGIRGTIVGGSIDGDKTQVILLGPGPANNTGDPIGGITVSNQFGSVDINAGGWATTLTPGAAPVPPFQAPSSIRGGYTTTTPPPENGNGGTQTTASSGGPATGQTPPAPGPGSATNVSGQGTAQGGANFNTAMNTLGATQPDASHFASQTTNGGGTSLADGPSSWDQILSIPSGTAGYDLNGTYAGCDSCGTSATQISGTMRMTVNVDFGARQFTTVYFSLDSTLSNDSKTQSVAIDYGTLASQVPSGTQAAYSFTTAQLGGLTTNNGDFGGSSIIFQNSGGQAGAAAKLVMKYKNTSFDAQVAGQGVVSKGPEVGF
jgi:hypothetical protein